jgi:hypothetical protein
VVFRLIIAIILSTGGANAADISKHSNDSKTLNAIAFVGEIEDGDAFRLKSYFAKLPDKKFTAIYFDSDGGNLFEGMEIGRFIRSAGIRSVTESDTACMSACALAFLGGYDFYSKAPWRTKASTSELGFHAFTPNFDNAPYSQEEINAVAKASQLITLMMIEYFEDVEGDIELLKASFSTDASVMYLIGNSAALDYGVNVWDEQTEEMVYSSKLQRLKR